MSVDELKRSLVLIVDDEPANVELLEGCLAGEGYTRMISLTDSRQVLDTYQREEPDIVLLDLHMPYVDGFEVMRLLREHVPEDDYLPILVLTADITGDAKRRALSGGARDFLSKPFDLDEVLQRIANLLETRLLHRQQRAARRAAEAAEEGARLLAEASRVLATSFDYQTTLSALARLTVPGLADYAVVQVLQDDGSTARLGVAHVDPAKEPLLYETAVPTAGASLPRHHPVVAAMVEGRSTLATEITPDMVQAVMADERHGRIVEQLGPRSLIAVPVRTSTHILGSLVLVQAESGRRFGMAELQLAQELASRAGLAVENARLYHAAQRALRARDEVLSVVAHDLRNPLNAILLGVDSVLEELPASQWPMESETLENVAMAARRMDRLIQDLLEVARVESGKLHVEPFPERIERLVQEALAMLGPVAGTKGIALECETAPDLPPVMADGARVLQVISNLVGNAIKFTPAGGRIRITAEVVEAGVQVAVCDTGPGIAPEQLPHIFSRLWQGSERDRRGIGLGLSIAKGIVEAHRGSIWVESRKGEGSRFYFTLPRAASVEEPRMAPPAVVG